MQPLKKIYQGFTIPALLTTVVLASYPPTAVFCNPQPQAHAKQIIAAVKIPTNFEARFTYSRYEREDTDPTTVTGQLWIKGAAYRLVLPDQTLISNGKICWNYWPDIQEVHIHTVHSDDSLESFSPIDILRLYRTHFIPLSSNTITEKDRLLYDVVTMLAKEDTSVINQLVLTIEHKHKTIRHIKAYEKDGTVHAVTFLTFVPKKSFPKHYFEFAMPTDQTIEVIDLR